MGLLTMWCLFWSAWKNYRSWELGFRIALLCHLKWHFVFIENINAWTFVALCLVPKFALWCQPFGSMVYPLDVKMQHLDCMISVSEIRRIWLWNFLGCLLWWWICWGGHIITAPWRWPRQVCDPRPFCTSACVYFGLYCLNCPVLNSASSLIM